MADKDDIELEDDFLADEESDSSDAPVEAAKNNLTKRRVIDNLLEERRLKKQLADYDYDL